MEFDNETKVKDYWIESYNRKKIYTAECAPAKVCVRKNAVGP